MEADSWSSMYWPAVTDSRNRSARFSSCERTNAKYTVLAFCIVWRFPTQPEFRTYTAAEMIRAHPRARIFCKSLCPVSLSGAAVALLRHGNTSALLVAGLAPFFLITGENGVSKTRTRTLGPGARTSGPTAAPLSFAERGERRSARGRSRRRTGGSMWNKSHFVHVRQSSFIIVYL